jgi:hypothetical protein
VFIWMFGLRFHSRYKPHLLADSSAYLAPVDKKIINWLRLLLSQLTSRNVVT